MWKRVKAKPTIWFLENKNIQNEKKNCNSSITKRDQAVAFQNQGLVERCSLRGGEGKTMIVQYENQHFYDQVPAS